MHVHLFTCCFCNLMQNTSSTCITDRNVELYPQFFLELITTQLRFHMVSPQIVLLNLYYVISLSFLDTLFQHDKFLFCGSVMKSVHTFDLSKAGLSILFCRLFVQLSLIITWTVLLSGATQICPWDYKKGC